MALPKPTFRQTVVSGATVLALLFARWSPLPDFIRDWIFETERWLRTERIVMEPLLVAAILTFLLGYWLFPTIENYILGTQVAQNAKDQYADNVDIRVDFFKQMERIYDRWRNQEIKKTTDIPSTFNSFIESMPYPLNVETARGAARFLQHCPNAQNYRWGFFKAIASDMHAGEDSNLIVLEKSNFDVFIKNRAKLANYLENIGDKARPVWVFSKIKSSIERERRTIKTLVALDICYHARLDNRGDGRVGLFYLEPLQ